MSAHWQHGRQCLEFERSRSSPPSIVPLGAQSVLAPAPAGAIMGGIPVPSSVAPSVVALVDRRFNDQFCGGTVVAAEWILTAAHCAIGYRSQPGTIEVVGGRADLRTQTGTVIPVLEIVIHPAFDRAARRNDLALLRLTAPMPQPAAPLMTADVEPTYTRSDDRGGCRMGGGHTERQRRRRGPPRRPDPAARRQRLRGGPRLVLEREPHLRRQQRRRAVPR